jgi:hypothetical protein
MYIKYIQGLCQSRLNRESTSHSSRYIASERTTQKTSSIIVETLQRNCPATILGAYFYSNALPIVVTYLRENVFSDPSSSNESYSITTSSPSVLWKVHRIIRDLNLNNKKFEMYSHSNYTTKFICTCYCVCKTSKTIIACKVSAFLHSYYRILPIT